MSWLYLPELVADCSQADCSVGEPSAPLKSTSIASEFCSKGSEMECSTSFQSGMTCEPLTESSGIVESMSLPQGFLANLSASQESNLEMPTNGTCGQKLFESFVRYDPGVQCWRTRQRSFIVDTLEEFSATWPTSGLMRSGECFRLPEWEHRTYDRDYGFWPTPVASDSKRGDGLSRDSLSKAYNSRTGREGRGPACANLCEVLAVEFDCALQPTFSEWLMGWPIDWTALEPLATDKFRQWLSAHGMS